MKKILITLLSIALLLSAVGCNQTPPDVPNDTDNQTENSGTKDQLISYDNYDKFSADIYLCDDVYRSDDTPTHGSGSIMLPMAQDVLELIDYDILLCTDACTPESVVSRASQGYAPAYRVVPDGEIDGNFKVLKFKMEIPEPMLEDIKKQGVYEQIVEEIESQYYYLLVLDEMHYAYIHLERIDGVEKIENEAELADDIVKNARISFNPKKLDPIEHSYTSDVDNFIPEDASSKPEVTVLTTGKMILTYETDEKLPLVYYGQVVDAESVRVTKTEFTAPDFDYTAYEVIDYLYESGYNVYATVRFTQTDGTQTDVYYYGYMAENTWAANSDHDYKWKILSAEEANALNLARGQYDPEKMAELIPNESAQVLFWLKTKGACYYFCSIRTLNGAGNAYTDEPPKEFAIYYQQYDQNYFSVIDAPIPAEYKYDSVIPVKAITGEGCYSMSCILKLTDGDKTYCLRYAAYEGIDQVYHPVSDDEVKALANIYPDIFEPIAATTQITEYKFNIPLGEKLDYIVPAAIYGEIHPYVIPDRYTPLIQTNEYSPDGVGYVTFGVANDMKPSNVFSQYYTYRITQKGGYITSVEEVETITKETVLQNGTPYSGNPVGKFTGVAYNRIRTATVSGNEISVGSYQSHTDAGGTYVGTYSYDAKTGVFSAELAFQYISNGNFITNDTESISGKLYEYGGFIHFVCENSNISTVDEKAELPITLYPVDTITDIADWDKLPWSESWERWKRGAEGRKTAPNAYNFIYNLVSGESDIPELNGLGIKDYSITLIEDKGRGSESTLSFTFTVTGNSLPETLPPGTYSKIVEEGIDAYIYDNKKPETWEEYVEEERIQRGLGKFGDNPAVQAVNTYLSWRASYEVSPYGEWDMTSYHLPYNYICAYYGNEHLEISFSELQRLMSDKFGIAVERPQTEMVHSWSICLYDSETDTIRYADTRGITAVHRFLDVREEDGITYVIVQLFADRNRLIPSHKVQYAIGEGEVFLGSEIIEKGNYEPRDIR